MIIASEIKQNLPQESFRLERRVRHFSNYHDSEVFVAQAEYQALMDAQSVEDGKPLDNGKARVFNFKFGSQPQTVKFAGQTWVFGDDGPGRDAYLTIALEPRILPYFRKDIHHAYVTLRGMAKSAADDLMAKTIKTFHGDDYRGIYLFASMFSEGEPHYVPPFTLRQKSGHWDYAADYLSDKKSVPPAGRIIDNPWAIDRELSEITSSELGASHKTTRFVQWEIKKEHPPDEVKIGAYDIVYVGKDPRATEDMIGIAPKLARVGGLVVTEGNWLSDILLHGNRNVRPFFTAEHYISEAQFLMKTR